MRKSGLHQLVESEVKLPHATATWLWREAAQLSDPNLTTALAEKYAYAAPWWILDPGALPEQAVAALVSNSSLPEETAVQWAVRKSWRCVCSAVSREDLSEAALEKLLAWSQTNDGGSFVALCVLSSASSIEAKTVAARVLLDWPEDAGVSREVCNAAVSTALGHCGQAWDTLLRTCPYPQTAQACLHANPYPDGDVANSVAAWAYTDLDHPEEASGVLMELLRQPYAPRAVIDLARSWALRNGSSYAQVLEPYCSWHESRRKRGPVTQWSDSQLEAFRQESEEMGMHLAPVWAEAAVRKLPCAYDSAWPCRSETLSWVASKLAPQTDTLNLWVHAHRALPRPVYKDVCEAAARACDTQAWAAVCNSAPSWALHTSRFQEDPVDVLAFLVPDIVDAGCVRFLAPHFDTLNSTEWGCASKLLETWAGSASHLLDTVFAINHTNHGTAAACTPGT